MTRILAAFTAVLLTCVPAAAQLDVRTIPQAQPLTGAERMGAVQGSGCTAKTTPCASVAITPALITTFLAPTFQPLDTDLSAIAALATTSTGRDLLTSADAAAIRSKAGLGTAATANTGTSGATVPLLNTANTWSFTQTFSGAISGASTIQTSSTIAGYASLDTQVSFSPAGIEVGRTGRSAAGSSFIDWHSSASSPDYDVRLVSSGGTTTSGQGALSILAASTSFSGPIIQSAAFTPASATAACTTGQMAWDTSYEYRCVATNTWRRAALAAW